MCLLLDEDCLVSADFFISLKIIKWTEIISAKGFSLLPAHRDAQKQCKKKKYFAGLGSWPLVKRKEEDLKSKNLTQFVYSPLRDWEFME